MSANGKNEKQENELDQDSSGYELTENGNEGNIGDAQSKSLDSPNTHEEIEKWKRDYLYLKADFENYKKQMIKERSDLVKYGSERLILSLLDVLDVFDKALDTKVDADTLDAFVKGVKLTSDELKGALQRFGLKGLDPLGEPFDPSQHEALSSEETTQVPPGHVSQVFRRAYKLHDRVIRPAQVVVAKEPKESKDTTSSNNS
ncbi:MAG: nucleotide exchange factor GrpE [Bdellovibrionales bacterium]|nr:nucleotide exchange factor GrpE [Bdellovibrionales bacterium]